jgi:hypothetical protein
VIIIIIVVVVVVVVVETGGWNRGLDSRWDLDVRLLCLLCFV